MNEGVQEIDIDKIVTEHRQRTNLGDLNSLQLSIERHGLIHPIIVEPKGDKFVLIAGERRLMATKNLGKVKIKAIHRKCLDELDRREVELEENLKRKNLGYLEEAIAIRDLDKLKREKYGTLLPGRLGAGRVRGWGQRDTAQTLGLSEAKVSQDIKLANMLAEHPEIADIPYRREALRELRRFDLGLAQERSESELIRQFKECFLYSPPTKGVPTIEKETVKVLLLDVRDAPKGELIAEAKRVLLPAGHGFIFFHLSEISLIVEELHKNRFSFHPKPYIWHIRGKDDYVPYLWFSPHLKEPPKHLRTHLSYNHEKDSLHSQAKPYQLYYTLVIPVSIQEDFVIEPVSYGLGIVKVCMDTGRHVQAFCPSSTLRDKLMLQLGRKK